MNQEMDTIPTFAQQLKAQPKEQVFDFIRERLAFEQNMRGQLRNIDKDEFLKEHRRFEMSGYESKTGECTLHNLAIVNAFADLGIYDHTHYLFLDFYKGHGTLYLRYFNDTENIEIELGGYGTVEIIYEIFEKTIFLESEGRRRN